MWRCAAAQEPLRQWALAVTYSGHSEDHQQCRAVHPEKNPSPTTENPLQSSIPFQICIHVWKQQQVICELGGPLGLSLLADSKALCLHQPCRLHTKLQIQTVTQTAHSTLNQLEPVQLCTLDRHYLNAASLLSLPVVQHDNIENGSGSLKQNRVAAEHQTS